ncbi:hypothetical protein LTR56_018237 [Elasticomyces elasticus]|nr:hypothetical protein LTR56_018237 [Elasticomyces elasticus]KAK3658596.1 hypothetical protein LTR22_008949 [Elasticomyces elasticus]KAK4906795.1 hypothetical protein LTR49_024123 [Elasticomyces elasticus]KAK5766970.1 hypothetical protein LTS12_002734 [Elasticomyces elasticus]
MSGTSYSAPTMDNGDNCYLAGYAFDTGFMDETSHLLELLGAPISHADVNAYYCPPSMQYGYLSPINTPDIDLTHLDEFPLHATTTVSSTTTPLSGVSDPSAEERLAPVIVQGPGVCAAQGQRRKVQNRSAQRAYRERQRGMIVALGAQVEALKTDNAQLKAKSARLESELMTLQREMLMHFERVHGAGGALMPPKSGS